MNEELGIRWTTRASVALALLVLASAAVLGYTALADLFRSVGLFAAWLAWLFPVLFDAMEVAAAVAVFNARLQGEDDRFAWRLVVDFTLLGVAANCLHAEASFVEGRIAGWQMLLAMALTSLFPVSVALAVHLLKGVVGRHMARTGRAVRMDELARAEAGLEARTEELSVLVRGMEEKAARLEAEVGPADQSSEKVRLQGVFLEYLKENPRATLEEAGRVVGRAPSTVKEWAAELKRDGVLDRNGHGWEVPT